MAKTLLTGKVEPIPDNKPALKVDDHYWKMFSAKTIPDCIRILAKDIIPYWWKYKTKYPCEYKEIAEIIYYWLIARSVRCDKMLPFVPHYNVNDSYGGFLSELINWIAITEVCLEYGKENSWDKMSLSTKALNLFVDNPTASVTAIALELRVHRQRLYEKDCTNFIKVRQEYKKAQQQSRYNAKPRGTKDAKTGDIEAWS